MGYTKEQREANAKKKAEAENKDIKISDTDALKAELEAKIRAELEAKYKTQAITIESNNITIKKEKKKIPLDTMIPCKSGVQGLLVYDSKRIQGYRVEWDEYGSIEYMDLQELVSMRNTCRSFYKLNWIFFDDTDEYSAEDIYEFLGVSNFYENIIVGDDIDTIFEMTPDEIKSTINKLSKGIKDTIALKAKQLIDSGKFDSNNRIKALEEVLDIELSPHLN